MIVKVFFKNNQYSGKEIEVKISEEEDIDKIIATVKKINKEIYNR